MSSDASITATWEKILEYASSPVHGTMSRKLRKGVKLQVNNGILLQDAQIFISDSFVRFTFKDNQDTNNIYYDSNQITSIRTISTEEM